jgi:hypothetical protein
MKLDLLKKIIKEAVKEAVREELETILSEDVNPKSIPVIAGGKGTPSTFTKYENYKPITAKPVSTGDPIMDLLNETRATMTATNSAAYKPNMSSMVQAPGLGMKSMMIEESFQGPEPGLDISQFDFINKAASVYKASVQKDKERFGA